MSRKQDTPPKPGSGIARKLVLRAVATGLAASILLSAFEFGIDYHQRQAFISTNIEEVGTTFLPSLAKSIWAYNLPQVRLQIEAIIQQPSVSSAQLYLNDTTEPMHFGNNGGGKRLIERSFAISHTNHRNEIIPLGRLVLIKNFDEERENLIGSGLTGFVGNSLIIAVIAYSILHIFQLMVTHRLERMASRWSDISDEDLRNENPRYPVVPDQPDPTAGDELDELGRVIELLFTTGSRALRDADEKEQVLIELKKKADTANTAKSEFLANMSHEIRTPLNGVIGIAELLRKTELSKNQALLVRHLNTSARNLMLIINDILDFSRIESGQLDINPAPCDIDQIPRDVASNFAPMALQKGIDLICPASAPANARLLVDSTRIKQVLINLVSNAVKFTSQGEVALHYSCKTVDDGSQTLLFEVTDTGPGIPQETQAHLFERFTQADTSVTREFSGTGLGLAISKRLVELMGGEIGFDTGPSGSRFWFSLHATSCEPQATAFFHGPTTEKVLIVDQNSTNLRYLVETLDQWGVPVETLPQADEALERLINAHESGKPFTRVLIDHRLTTISSQVLANRIRQLPGLAALPLVLMSYDLLLGERSTPGFDAVVSKPVQPESLYPVLFGTAQLTQLSLQDEAVSLQPQHFHARVLIAEDNPTNRLVIEGMMRHLGVDFDSASNGREAINLLERYPYDLVFMDCQMPTLDGYQATREIRKHVSGQFDPGIPVIAMTANALSDDRGKCQAAGMNDYLSKPITLDMVSGVLGRWLATENQADHTGNGDRRSPPDPASGDIGVFDEQGIRALLLDDEELIASVIQTFLADIPTVIDSLRSELEAGRMQQAAGCAHRIKGAADNVAARHLRSVALALESAARTDDREETGRLLQELERAFTQLETALGARGTTSPS